MGLGSNLLFLIIPDLPIISLATLGGLGDKVLLSGAPERFGLYIGEEQGQTDDEDGC